MDRAHRKELKHDAFVERVGHSVEYAAGHKSQVLKWGGVAVALLLAILAGYLYTKHQRSVRQEDLRVAIRAQEAQVGPATNEFIQTYATQAEKDTAVQKSWNDLANRYSGKPEGLIAHYYLGINAGDKGNLAEAEKHFKLVAESGKGDYASQAKFSLAQIYESTGKTAEAEKLLRSLISGPTILVSKEQATIALGRMLSKTNPTEARKLLEPLRTERGPVSRAALTALGEMSAR